MRRVLLSFFLLAAFASPALAKTPLLLLTQGTTLRALEVKGLRLAQVLGAETSDGRNVSLTPSPLYASLLEVLKKDLQAVQARDSKAGVGMKYVHRLFDLRWLVSPRARFELVGVANRLDRQPFNPQACGEIRLIYRLAYEEKVGDKALYSRLPMTVNVVFWAQKEGGDCRPVAERWFVPDFPSPEASAVWLTSGEGPLFPSRLLMANLKSVEVNVQSIRWPSTIRPDLGGHAEYILRVFHRDPQTGRLKPALLENTPDVPRLLKDPKLLEALKKWIRDADHLNRIDEGTAVLPDAFLADKAESVSPHGWARAANRPFSALFRETDFGDLDFSKRGRVHSPKGLLRRLDDLSCLGCHQARSVAGFHLLGEDPPQTFSANAIASPASPHLQRDLPRRETSLLKMRETGQAIPDRPLSERADRGEGGWGSHCGLGDASFAAWTCDAGLQCVRVHGEGGSKEVGECFSAEINRVGEPCERGTFRPKQDFHADGLSGAKPNACEAGICEAGRVGFPDGMCAVSCGSGAPQAECGAIAILTDFNACLARSVPFDECLSKNVRPAGLRACDAGHPCRDDYLCARGADGKNTCIPPYFLFQMRVDGH